MSYIKRGNDMGCPKCNHRWLRRVNEPLHCPKCRRRLYRPMDSIQKSDDTKIKGGALRLD